MWGVAPLHIHAACCARYYSWMTLSSCVPMVIFMWWIYSCSISRDRGCFCFYYYHHTDHHHNYNKWLFSTLKCGLYCHLSHISKLIFRTLNCPIFVPWFQRSPTKLGHSHLFGMLITYHFDSKAFVFLN
jgi:hypothetical protein